MYQENCDVLSQEIIAGQLINALLGLSVEKETYFVFFSRDELREHLKNAPKIIMSQKRAGASDSDSSDSSSEGLWEGIYTPVM